MTGTFPTENNSSNSDSQFDFDLGIADFHFSDLYRAEKLKELAENFYAELNEREPVLAEELTKYIEARGADYEQRAESKLLTDAAPYLSDFVARLFHVEKQRENLLVEINRQDPIWKYKFFVQRRAIKKFPAELAVSLNQNELSYALRELQSAAFDETMVHDEELAISEITTQLLEAEELLSKEQPMTPTVEKTLLKVEKAYDKLKDTNFGKLYAQFVNEIIGEASGALLQVKAVLRFLEAWSAVHYFKPEAKAAVKNWQSFKVPHALDFQTVWCQRCKSDARKSIL